MTDAPPFAPPRKPRLGVSSCLLGEEVRYNGGHKRDRFLTEILAPYVEWVAVCPEVEIGLGTPRPAIRLVQIGGATHLIAPDSGADHTRAMVDYAARRVAELAGEGLAGYVLKKDSPSCGMERVKVYGESGRVVRDGRGLFAEALLRLLPGLPVEEEGRLNDPYLRASFVRRIFAYDDAQRAQVRAKIRPLTCTERRSTMQKSLRTLPVLAALAVFALGAMSATPATAGLHYQAVSSGEAGGRSHQTKVEGWVSGDKARVEFKQSDNPAPMAPMTKAGNYIITKDGGKTLYLVNTEDKTYAQWDLNAMLGMVGGVMNGMGPMLKFEFSDPKVEKLGEEDGGTVVGYPTRHYKYRTSYSMKMKVFGMASTADTVTEQEVWATTKLADGGLKVWLRADPPRTGNEAFDKLIAAEAEKSKTTGFPLKTVSTTTSTRKGKASVSKHSMEVTLLENKAVPDSSFEIPAGYKETKMLEEKGESPNER